MAPAMRNFAACLMLCCITLIPARADTGMVPDLRLLVDVSENMEKLDPENLRALTLEMFVRAVPRGSRVGIWVFGEQAHELVPSGIVDSAWRQGALEALSSLEYSGPRTNIPAALEAATADLEELEDGYRSSVVLLAAGKVDVADSPMINVSAARKMLSGLAIELGGRGVPVHTIGFAREADSLLLRSLARETGGTSEQAQDPSELGGILLKVMEIVVPETRQPLYGREFSVDERVEQFTVLAVFPKLKGKLKLIAPDGSIYSAQDNPGDFSWFRNRQFSMARVEIPQQGSWRLQYPAKTDARVYVVADLDFEVGALPHYTAAGHEAEVELRLIERGEPITDPAILSRYQLLLEVTSPRGTSERFTLDKTDEDGLYRVITPALQFPGRYRLMLRLEGEGIEREMPVYIEVGVPVEQPTLVTRGEEPPEDDFQAPLIWLTGVSSALLLMVWYILHRRKQRKLALWQRRAREMRSNGNQATLGGAVAVDAEKEPS